MKKIIRLGLLLGTILLPAISFAADDPSNQDSNGGVTIAFNSFVSNDIVIGNDIRLGQEGSYRLVSPESLSNVEPSSISFN